MTRGGADIHLYRRHPELIREPSCSGTLECTLTGVADHLLILGWLLFMVVVAIGTLVVLPKARNLCDRELKRTRSEYEAFDQFIGRMQHIVPTTNSPTIPVGDTAPLLHRQTMPTGSLESVSQAYEETVMAVPHYEEEYDETIAEHMRQELSDEVAEAVLGEVQLTPPLHRSVLDAAVAARDRRAHLIEMLEEEAHSIATHETDLREMAHGVEEVTSPLCADQTFDGLQRQHEVLSLYEERIQDIVNSRQTDRTGGRVGAARAGKSLDLQTYLYRSLNSPYPVLSEATRLLARVNITRRRVEDELIYRG